MTGVNPTANFTLDDTNPSELWLLTHGLRVARIEVRDYDRYYQAVCEKGKDYALTSCAWGTSWTVLDGWSGLTIRDFIDAAHRHMKLAIRSVLAEDTYGTSFDELRAKLIAGQAHWNGPKLQICTFMVARCVDALVSAKFVYMNDNGKLALTKAAKATIA